MRTPQTFYQELIIPFVIVLLFVAIGQAEFLQEGPAIKMDPTLYGPSTLYYNNDYTKVNCPNPSNLKTCTPSP